MVRTFRDALLRTFHGAHDPLLFRNREQRRSGDAAGWSRKRSPQSFVAARYDVVTAGRELGYSRSDRGLAPRALQAQGARARDHALSLGASGRGEARAAPIQTSQMR